MFGKILIGVALATFGLISFATAQQQLPAATQQTATIKRTPLQKFDVPGTNYETVIGMVGEMVLFVEGQPEKTVKAGQSYQVPPGAVHDAKTGPSGAKVVATYVVEKGKPLASPAP